MESVYEGVQGFFFKTHGAYFKKLYQHFKEYPLPEGEEQQDLKDLAGEEANGLDGVSLSHLHEVFKVLGLIPQVISRQDLQSLVIQSQTLHEVLSLAEFVYLHFLLFTVVEEKQKLFQKAPTAAAMFIQAAGDASPAKDRVSRRLEEFFMTPQLNQVDVAKSLNAIKEERNVQKTAITYGGDLALEKIKESHNELVLQKLNAKAGLA